MDPDPKTMGLRLYDEELRAKNYDRQIHQCNNPGDLQWLTMRCGLNMVLSIRGGKNESQWKDRVADLGRQFSPTEADAYSDWVFTEAQKYADGNPTLEDILPRIKMWLFSWDRFIHQRKKAAAPRLGPSEKESRFQGFFTRLFESREEYVRKHEDAFEEVRRERCCRRIGRNFARLAVEQGLRISELPPGPSGLLGNTWSTIHASMPSLKSWPPSTTMFRDFVPRDVLRPAIEYQTPAPDANLGLGLSFDNALGVQLPHDQYPAQLDMLPFGGRELVINPKPTTGYYSPGGAVYYGTFMPVMHLQPAIFQPIIPLSYDTTPNIMTPPSIAMSNPALQSHVPNHPIFYRRSRQHYGNHRPMSECQAAFVEKFGYNPWAKYEGIVTPSMIANHFCPDDQSTALYLQNFEKDATARDFFGAISEGKIYRFSQTAPMPPKFPNCAIEVAFFTREAAEAVFTRASSPEGIVINGHRLVVFWSRNRCARPDVHEQRRTRVVQVEGPRATFDTKFLWSKLKANIDFEEIEAFVEDFGDRKRFVIEFTSVYGQSSLAVVVINEWLTQNRLTNFKIDYLPDPCDGHQK